MTIADFNPDRPHHLTTVLTRVAGPYQAGPNDGAILARRLPPTSNAGQAGTRATAGALRAPRRLSAWLEASSMGLDADFFFSGTSRMVVAAGATVALPAGRVDPPGSMPDRRAER